MDSLTTLQRKLILYHENILGCQRNNPRGNVLPSLRSGGLFYPHCVPVKHIPPFTTIGKNKFSPLVLLWLPKFFHDIRTYILLLRLHLLQTQNFSLTVQVLSSFVVITNTYQCNLAEFGNDEKEFEKFIKDAVEVARLSEPEVIAGSVGPYASKYMNGTSYTGISFS